MSLKTKAGILGVVYAFEQMITKSAAFGMNMKNFNAVTGLSTTAVQNLQNAARQYGVTADEVSGSVAQIQKSMYDMMMGKGAPGALGWFSRAGVDLDFKKAIDPSKGPLYMVEKYQEFVKKAEPGLVSALAPVSTKMQAFFKQNTANLWHNNLGPVLSPQQLSSLQKAESSVLNLENAFSHGMDKFTIKHGDKMITDLNGITKALFNLIDALTSLAETLKVFPLLGGLISASATIANLASVAIEDSSGKHKSKSNDKFGKESIIKRMLDFRDSVDSSVKNGFSKQVAHSGVSKSGRGSGQTVVNQNIVHNGPLGDTRAVGETHKMAAKNAHREHRKAFNQSSAQNQGG